MNNGNTERVSREEQNNFVILALLTFVPYERWNNKRRLKLTSTCALRTSAHVTPPEKEWKNTITIEIKY